MNSENRELNNQLKKAVKNYRARKVSKLIKKGAAPNTTINDDGKTLVMEAALNCYPKTLKALIDSGADIHQKTKGEGLNAFLFACSSGCIETITILTEAGAKVTETDINKKNGLMYTVKYKEIETVKYLTEKGIDINARDTDGESTLHFALEGLSRGLEDETDQEYVKQLINLGADVNQKNNDGNSFFTFAVRSEYIDFVKFILENGGDVKNHGNNLFSAALGNDSRDITEFLWEHSYKNTQLCIRYAVEFKCTHCNALLPVNGPVKNLLCPSCQTENEIEESFWIGLLEDSVFMYASTIDIGDGRYELERTEPVCSNCKTEIALSEIDNNEQLITCKSCGNLMNLYPVPDWLQTIKVFGLIPKKVISPVKGQIQNDNNKPVKINCTSCNALLKVSSSSTRNFECEHCGTNQYLNDTVWLSLHPIETKQNWYIRFV